MKVITNEVRFVIGCDFHPSFQRIAVLERRESWLCQQKSNSNINPKTFLRRESQNLAGCLASPSCMVGPRTSVPAILLDIAVVVIDRMTGVQIVARHGCS